MPTDSPRKGKDASLPGAAKPREHSIRLHHLDWLRALMVWCVVYAHVDRTIGSLSVGGWIPDDHVLGEANSHALVVRWVSLMRQWCLPLLFWVSGAAIMLSWKGSVKGFRKIGLMTLAGIGANAALWFLSPADPACSPQQPCPGKGIIFSFNIVYASGTVFPLVFQMWYTIALMLYMLLNWPLCIAVSLEGEDKGQMKRLAPQWIATVLFASALIKLSGETCEHPVAAIVWVAVTEAAFLGIASMVSPASQCPADRKRLLHYALAALTVMQFAVTPFAARAATLGPSFAAYVLLGFNKFFGLGIVMTQGRSHGSEVDPILSRYWPVTLILFAFNAPSTNWLLAGNLTFPFYTQTIDRVLYVTGSVIVIYVLDRCSRWGAMQCEPCPDFLNNGSVVLYLIHPVLITAFICAGIMNSETIWFLSSALCFGLVYVVTEICSAKKKVSARESGNYEQLPAFA